MSFVNFFTSLKFIPERKMLELFPPFFFMGVKVLRVSHNYRHMHLRVPMRWYGTNMHGSMFGGFMCAVSDPLPTLLCERIFKDVQVWTRRNSVEFLRPARSPLDLKLDITEGDIEAIQSSLDVNGQAIHTFEYCFRDKRGHVVAEVLNTIYLRRKIKLLQKEARTLPT